MGKVVNTDLLMQIADSIEADPSDYDQDEFGFEYSSKLKAWTNDCNTPCCIAGWAIRLSDVTVPAGESISVAAKRLLGLSKAEGDKLFGAMYWDDQNIDTLDPDYYSRVVGELRKIARGEREI